MALPIGADCEVGVAHARRPVFVDFDGMKASLTVVLVLRKSWFCRRQAKVTCGMKFDYNNNLSNVNATSRKLKNDVQD